MFLSHAQVSLVCDLPVLQLYLLAGMARLDAKKQSIYNFEVGGVRGVRTGVRKAMAPSLAKWERER